MESVDREWLRERALNVIGHELRTPASTIRGLAETLAADPDGPTRDELIAALARNGRRLEGLLDDLLTATGITTALPPTPPAVLDLAAALRAGPLTDAEMAISGTAVVRARPESLSRIIGAVLDNAKAYGETPVRVTVQADPSTVSALIDSPGPAVPHEDVQYALEPFWRGERAVTTKPGLGLGLTVASVLAAYEGGCLTVEALAGGGLRTRLELPAG